MTSFKEDVYRIVRKIPRGKVSTYGEIALKLGKPRWSRQVGWALHQNKDVNTPCHRVVDRNGRLSPNFAFSGAVEQRSRLEKEKATLKDNMHIDLSKSLWTI